MSIRVAASLLLLASVSNAVVQFAHSSLYDIYDFQGVKEVALPRCANGCVIYAAIEGDAQDVYMNNLVIYDHNTGKDISIAYISKQLSGAQKLPYDLVNAGSYSIINHNAADAKGADVAIYVIDRAQAKSVDYEIYDAGAMARGAVAPATVVTVIGARRFLVKADKGQANSFTARATGFDNALDNNADDCTYAYKTQTFDGFEFHVHGPLVSLVFAQKNPVNINANYDWLNVRDLSKAGFLTSPGFHGCTKVDQVFRQLDRGFYGEDFDLHSEPTNLRVVWDVDANAGQDLVIKDMTGSKRTAVKGLQKNLQVVMENTQFATVYYDDATPPLGFIARHTATPV